MSNIQHPIDTQIACIEKEISKRQYVYPSLVARGKMTQGTAEKEISCMKAILNTLNLAKRTYLDKSWNQIEVSAWQTYPEHQPSDQDIYTEFLVAYLNPRHINKSGLTFNAPTHLFEISEWLGNGFLPHFKDTITHYMPLPKLPKE